MSNSGYFVLWAVCFSGLLFVFWRVSVVLKKFYNRLFEDMKEAEDFFKDKDNRKKMKKAATDILANGIEKGIIGIYEKISEKRKEDREIRKR